MTDATEAQALRVFISYAVGPMTAPALALRGALARRGIGSWTVHADTRVGTTWEDSINEAIRQSEAFVILVSPGDEHNRWLLFETRHILTRAWSGDDVRVAVLAPAVGAIPSALRHQDFVSYFAHDEIRLDRWSSDPSAVDTFVGGWLRAAQRPQPAAPLSRQDQLAHWRNAVVHLGRRADLEFEERRQVLESLRDELSGDHWARRDAAPSIRLDAALQRAVLAQQLGESELAVSYFNLASQAVPAALVTADAGVEYAAGLALMGADDSAGATELFRSAAAQYELSHGRTDPRTIAALYNVGLALATSGDEELAAEAYRAALDRSRDGLGPHHPQTASAAFNLAQLRARAGAIEEAIRLLEDAQEAYELVTPADSPELAAVRSELARLRR